MNRLTLITFYGALVFALPALPTSTVAAPSPAHRAADLVREGDALMQQSRDALDPSRYAPARAAYERALALEPQLPAAMLGLAWVYNSLHEFSQGAQWCEAALAIDDGLADAYALRGDGEVELGEYDRALDCYQRALDLRPDLASYSRAAHLLWLTGQPERARELMRAAIAAGGIHAENTAWCEAQLALMHWQAGDLASAGVIVRAALERAPRNPHLLHAAARVAAARREFSAAADWCEQSIAIAPTHEALADLAEYHAAAGNAGEGRDAILRVIRFHATNHVHLPPSSIGAVAAATHREIHGNAQLALFLADHNLHLDRARAEAAAAMEATPNVAAAEALAWCQFQNGQTAEAAATIMQALRWNTPSPLLHGRAGLILAASGDVDAARRHLTIALRLNPQFHPRLAPLAASTLAGLP